MRVVVVVKQDMCLNSHRATGDGTGKGLFFHEPPSRTHPELFAGLTLRISLFHTYFSSPCPRLTPQQWMSRQNGTVPISVTSKAHVWRCEWYHQRSSRPSTRTICSSHVLIILRPQLQADPGEVHDPPWSVRMQQPRRINSHH